MQEYQNGQSTTHHPTSENPYKSRELVILTYVPPKKTPTKVPGSLAKPTHNPTWKISKYLLKKKLELGDHQPFHIEIIIN
jgi:hypothetical protein